MANVKTGFLKFSWKKKKKDRKHEREKKKLEITRIDYTLRYYVQIKFTNWR